MQKRLLFVLLLSATMTMVSCRKDIEAVNVGTNPSLSTPNLNELLDVPVCQWESIVIKVERDPRDVPRSPRRQTVLRTATLDIYSNIESGPTQVPRFPITLNEGQTIPIMGLPPFISTGGRIEYRGNAKVTITVRVQGINDPFDIILVPNFGSLEFETSNPVISKSQNSVIFTSQTKYYGIGGDCSLTYF